MKIFIIIPAFNEKSKIGKVIQEVREKFTNIIVVDDGSSDKTLARAKAAGVVVLHHIVNRGQGAALQTGIDYALSQNADIIVMFDADGQHDAEDIEKLIKPIKLKQVDVVLGSRFLKSKIKSQKLKIQTKNQKLPIFVTLRLRLARLHQWFFTGLKVTDSHCGLRAFSRLAAEKIIITQDRMAHASEILDKIARQKISFKEVPVSIKYTKYSLHKGQRSFLGSVKVLYDYFVGRVV